MRKNRRTLAASFCIFAILTLLVITLNVVKQHERDEREQEITLGKKVENSEMKRKRDMSLKEAWMSRKTKVGGFPGIYVREAYRVSNDEIRMVYLENQDNAINLKARLANQTWQPVEWSCFNKTCMDILFCSLATRFGSLKIDENSGNVAEIHVTSEMNDEYTVVPVRDVRFRGKYEHQLGVCLNPIFFFTDWTAIVQFMESWLAQGATKFYFYLHSYTWQTKHILNLYKESLGDSLELIEWSDVPVAERDRGNYEKDPNSRIFRQGATAFMHDCMLRARSNVKFISNTDLDDLPVAHNLNIAQVLNEVSERHPNAAQFKADWILSHQPQNWDSVKSPNDIRFDLFATRVLQVESVRWDYRVSKKIFHRPERVIHFDMHSIYRNELMPDDENQYTTIEMFNNPKLFFLHLRRFERHLLNPPIVDYNNSFDSEILMKLNNKMHASFSKRIEGTKYEEMKLAPWAVEARQTMRDLEQCRREAFGFKLDDQNEMCQQSASGCEGMLSAGIKFIKTAQTWTNVAHKAYFNSYVEQKSGFRLF